jgi:hypothetical protein
MLAIPNASPVVIQVQRTWVSGAAGRWFMELCLQLHTSCALGVFAHMYTPVVGIKLLITSLGIGTHSPIQQVEEVSLQRAPCPAHFSNQVIALMVTLKRGKY